MSATAHSTEWMMTKTSDGVPSPNQISASGSNAIAGSGLNMAVSVDRMRVPIVLATAKVVNTAAKTSPQA